MEILEILKQNKIFSLWHFTDIRNLPLIEQLNGLRSKEFLEINGYLEKVICGGNETSHYLDKNLGNWNKISLSFTPHIPMAYHAKKEKHLIFIEIDPVIATFDGVYFTDCNATKIRNGQKREKGIKGLRNIKFEHINSNPKPFDPEWKKYVQAEVLVPNYIPSNFFKKIHFISEASLMLGKFLCSNIYHHLFAITPKVFADYDYYGNSWTIINPYLDKIIITDKEITKDNVENDHPAVDSIKQSKTYWMKTKLFATAGTKVETTLKDLENRIIFNKQHEFKKESIWFWFPCFQIPAGYLYDEIILEITLDNILWYKERRKVE